MCANVPAKHTRLEKNYLLVRFYQIKKLANKFAQRFKSTRVHAFNVISSVISLMSIILFTASESDLPDCDQGFGKYYMAAIGIFSKLLLTCAR